VVAGVLGVLGGCLALTIIAFIGAFIWQAKRIKALEQRLQSQQPQVAKEKPAQTVVGTHYGIISESDFASTRYENSDVLLGGSA
jgi:hypothetical protein